MSVQSSYNGFVRSLQEYLTEHGFEREGGKVFRRFSPEGDALIVELQTARASDKSQRAFFINVAMTLASCWEFDRDRYGLPRSALPTSEYGAWRHRIGFTGYSGSDTWVLTDDATAAEVWSQVRQRLEESLPELLQLLNRDRAMELAESRELLGHASWLVRAWLLAERGPSAELDDVLFAQRPAATHTSAMTQAIVNYAKQKGSPSGG